MIKRIAFIFLLILFISCGKKLPPPSPDIFGPALISSVFHINSELRFTFNERITQYDSAFLYFNDSIYRIDDYYTENNVLAVQYKKPLEYGFADIYGIADAYGNKRNFSHIILKGSLIRDTIPPLIQKTIFSDSIIQIYFNESVDTAEIMILPSYIVLKKTNYMKNRVNVYIDDTIGLYPRELIIKRVEDMSGNQWRDRTVFEIASDSLYSHTLSYTLTGAGMEIRLLNIDSLHLYSLFADSGSTILFEGLLPGKYYLQADSMMELIVQ